jgi:hypothetical protein
MRWREIILQGIAYDLYGVQVHPRITQDSNTSTERKFEN